MSSIELTNQIAWFQVIKSFILSFSLDSYNVERLGGKGERRDFPIRCKGMAQCIFHLHMCYIKQQQEWSYQVVSIKDKGHVLSLVTW